MKKYGYFLLLFMIFSAGKCDEMECEISDDCFSDRAITQTHEWGNGEIKEVMSDYFAIVPEDGKGRYDACNLKEEFKKNGLKVKFCGVEKEIFSHEKRAATPFVLGHIKIRK